MNRTFLALLAAGCLAPCQAQSSRELQELNWREFAGLVPARIQTVLLPTGTIEAHGVLNNGADNTAPVDIARAIAPRLNALIAPLIPYGVTGSLDGYPGTFQISETAYRPFVADVLKGLARNGFRNIIVVNGHGGPQTAILNDLAEQASREHRVRVMVVNWWSACSDATLKVFGEDGGHAGWNETAFIQALHPQLVRRDLYSRDLEIPRPAAGSWAAYPFPAPVILYQAGQGSVRFDEAKAKQYFQAVIDCMANLIEGTIQRWDHMNVYPAAASPASPR
ncbi:MAG: creatininase family protein [Bryobacteraceae bacterium]